MIFKKYDVIIVGAGAAGLYTALNLDKQLKVLLLSKKELTLCNTALAQGGIAAVLDDNSDDIETHINDTLKAGGYENNRDNLRTLVEHGAENIEELIRLGVNFDRKPDGAIDLGLEGGHSRNRIVHHKDSTGYEIINALIEKVKSLENVNCIEHSHLFRLEKHNNVFFAEVQGVGATPLQYYTTNTVVIATGGIGQVYNYTTNSAVSTGDGIQFAYNLGADVKNMRYIQFHPTATVPVKNDKSQVLLITEAVRGEGAYLYNKNMERFCDELSTRDVISRCIIEEGHRSSSTDFYISLSHLNSDFIKVRFPMIYQRLLEKGYDFTKEPIPIYPCQHYLMGGIAVNDRGHTSVEGLYAVGECAFTGVHGVNRLASNSLLEVLVFSRRAAERISKSANSVECIETDIFGNSGAKYLPDGLRSEIRDIMQKAFFVVPDNKYTRKGLQRIIMIKELLDSNDFAVTTDFVEVKSLATVAYLILKEVMENDT